MKKKFKNIGAIGLLSANLLNQPLNIYANTNDVQLGKVSQASNDKLGSQKFEYKDENGKIQGIATITYPKQVAVGSKATMKIHFDWTNEEPDDVGICVIRGVSLMLTGAKYIKVSGVQKGKYALEDNRFAFIYDSGAVSGGKDITMEVTPEEAGEITISGALGYSQADPKVSANQQAVNISMTAYDENKQSITGSDFSMYVGDQTPTIASFKASATDKTGATSEVSVDLSKADLTKAGVYDAVISSADGQSKAVKLTVKANDQNISAEDFSMYVGDQAPTIASFKASATDKSGKEVEVSADLSKADLSKTGVYEVVITSADGQSKTVKLTVKANGKSFTAEDFSMYVGDADPTVSSFKALATDKDGKEVVVTADFSKANFKVAGTYDVALKSADGQTKTVKLTVNVNKQSLTGSDFSMYVGDAAPTVSSFKASGTDKTGAASTVTADFSKVDLSKAGVYDVVLNSADGQSKTVKLTVNANKQSITGSDFSMYVGDAMPTVSSFKASATDKTGAASTVTADFSKANFKVAGTYDVVLKSADGQSKTVKLTVNANKQSITGSDFSMYVGDADATVSSFKASATDKTGAASAVTADFSKVDLSKAGTYDVVLNSADGQSKTVKLTVNANKQSITGSDFSMYVGDANPTVSSFKASATDKTGAASAVTADLSKVNFKVAGVYDVIITSEDGQSKQVTLSVIASGESLSVKDSTLYVGANWTGADNFVSAKNAAGEDVAFSDVTVSGEVNTNAVGTYHVTYTYGGKESIALVHIIAKESPSDTTTGGNSTNNTTNNTTNNMINGDSRTTPEKTPKNVNEPALPKTGESDGINLSIFGSGTLLSILGALFLRRKNKKG